MIKKIVWWLLIVPFFSAAHASLTVDELVEQFSQSWAQANYRLQGNDKQQAFERLIQQVEDRKKQYPQAAEIWIWSGIIKSTYAKVEGGLGALDYAKQAKADLEQALMLDDKALSASAYTCLATLYYKVPGWPLGFGDDDKAQALFARALSIAPDDMNANYFYGRFLIDQNQLDLAEDYLIKAREIIPAQSKAIADQGRLKEIERALQKIARKKQQSRPATGIAFQ